MPRGGSAPPWGKDFQEREVDISRRIWYSWKELCHPGPARGSPRHHMYIVKETP